MASVPAADLNHILAHTSDIWRQLAGTRLFITGGTGFFGIWLLEAIAAANDILKVGVGVTVLSRDPAPFRARMPHLAHRVEFDWMTGDPASFVFPTRRHEYILHLATATSAHPGRTDPLLMLETKFASIRHILNYARHAGIRRMLVTSSGAVYGPQPEGLTHIPESYAGAPDPMLPDSAYANGKRFVEQVCALYPDLDTVIARCFAFIGPHLPLDGRFAAGNFIRDALADVPIVIRGDGRPLRSYLYAADLVIWLLTILVRGKTRHPYNVGSDVAVSIAELAHRVAAHTRTPHDIRILSQPASGLPPRYVPCIDRVRSELGLDVMITLDNAIESTLSWRRL